LRTAGLVMYNAALDEWHSPGRGCMRSRLASLAAALILVTVRPPEGAGQPLGTFRWQLRPFCNVVSLNVRQDGAVYTLDGYDDQCGAATHSSVVGTAFLNPDGTIGLGLSGATAPGAAPVMLYARLSLSSVSGTWSDSAGNTGTFVLTPGAGSGGDARPVPANGIRPGSVTGAQIAPATITADRLAPGAAQVPIVGTCPLGQYLRGVTPGGAVICEPFFVPTLSIPSDDSANSVGRFSSMAIGLDGLPVISHQDFTALAVRVTKCGNPACTAGNVSTTVDDPATAAGAFSSIAVAPDGLPVISYSEAAPAFALRVTKCGNPACTAGNISTTVDDPANNVGGYSSIAIGADGLPVISHRDETAAALRVTKCGNPACTAGNVSTTVDDPPGFVGAYSAIAIGADGLPVISHLDQTAFGLRVTKCGNPSCTAGNVSTTVDDPINLAGFSTSIAIGADGWPVISHQDATAFALRVTKCGNPACTAGTVSTTVDDPANSVGFDTSIAIGVDGLPVVSHRDQTAGALRVTKCGNPACTAGSVSTTIDDTTNQVGYYTSLEIGADGLPVVSHRDETAGALRVTKCGTQTCR
jgi:hypothetical protein